MSNSCYIFMLALLFLIFEVAQECSGKQQQRAVSLAGQGGRDNALKNLGQAMNECLRVQKLSRGALADLVKALPPEIHDMKTKIDSKDKTELTLIDYITDLKSQLKRQHVKVERLTGSNANLLVKLSAKNKQMEALAVTNAELLVKVSDKDKQMQNLGVQLLEFQREVQRLENMVYQMGQAFKATGRSETAALECTHPNQMEIKKLVREFNSTKQWLQLKKSLEDILDHCSASYMQLQDTGVYPFWYIGNHGYVQLLTVLLCGGLDVNTPDVDGDTMLHGAAESGLVHMVKVLLDYGADINRRGRHSRTPLIVSTEQGYLETVQFLVQEGANTTYKDDKGRTAINSAQELGIMDIAKYLEQFPH